MKHPSPLEFTERVAMHLDNIVGRNLQDAASILNEMDLSFRVVERDGVEGYIPDAKVRPGRVNLKIAQGLVKGYYIG